MSETISFASEIDLPEFAELKFGGFTLSGRALLAPMAGVTDAPFRAEALAMGAPAAVSEMVACEALLANRADMTRRAAPLTRHGESRSPDVMRSPDIRQLAGREPKWMKLGAARAREDGVDIIDINMGCPAKQVTGAAAGAALMRDPDLCARLIEAVLEGAAGLPVTVKMRLGWDAMTHQAPALAALADRLGVAAIIVHGRTRCQFYKGRADWTAVAAVRRAIAIPLIVNGDIEDLASARAALCASGADGVMVGRAAMGRPWLIGEIAAGLAGRDYQRPDRPALGLSLLRLHEESLRLYGTALGTKVARKHLAAWVDANPDPHSLPGTLEFRRALCTETDPARVARGVEAWFIEGDCARAQALLGASPGDEPAPALHFEEDPA